MKKLMILGFSLGVLGGCTSKYSCGQFPESGCQPVSTVYDRTHDGFHDYRRTLYETNKKGKQKEKAREVHVGQAHRTLNYITPGDPILTKPIVLRILFNAWEDQDKDLNTGGFVYVRLRDSEWVVNK